MSEISKIEKSILQLTNKKSTSLKKIISIVYNNVGGSKEHIEVMLQGLVNRRWVIEKNGNYRSNGESDLYLYPDIFYNILPNYKAIHKIVKAANLAYYPNLKFDEFYNDHLKGGIQRDKTKQILLLAYEKDFVKKLPLELRNNFSFYQRIKRFFKQVSGFITFLSDHPFYVVLTLIGTIGSIIGALYIFFPHWFGK